MRIIENPNIDIPRQINPTHPSEGTKSDDQKKEQARKINEKEKEKDENKRTGIDIYA